MFVLDILGFSEGIPYRVEGRGRISVGEMAFSLHDQSTEVPHGNHPMAGEVVRSPRPDY